MDRITNLYIRNVRAIESMDLRLSRGLTVLIGENGSGTPCIRMKVLCPWAAAISA